jgi:hypothetical protein
MEAQQWTAILLLLLGSLGGTVGQGIFFLLTRVSFETSFHSKQPKLEPKLVSTLSKTKRLFRLFRFFTETESFGVLLEQKSNRNSLIESIFWYFFQKIQGCFGLFWYVSKHLFWLFRFYTKTESFNFFIEPKQTEDQPKQSIFWYFSENLGLFRFVSKQFCLFQLFRYMFETLKQTEIFVFWFHETN